MLELIPQNSTVLDVGCGYGKMDLKMSEQRCDLSILGVDVLIRDKTYGNVTLFDGKNIPFPDNHFDVVMLVNVLHHANVPLDLLKESARVSRKYVLIKDHIVQGIFARQILSFMDNISNKKHGVSLPYNFLTKQQWQACFATSELKAREGGLFRRFEDVSLWA
jgi:ubiquinone/menaquinone biosynthesis C-methylase UbiE